MKTQASEWKEIRTQGILMIAFYVLVMTGILIISGGKSQEATMRHKGAGQRLNYKEAVPGYASSSYPAYIESESFMNNLYEALIPVDEPAIKVSDWMDMPIPAVTNEEVRPGFAENEYLQNVLKEKNIEVAAECALRWNMKDCLIKESEQPLKVEGWMVDESFWSHESK